MPFQARFIEIGELFGRRVGLVRGDLVHGGVVPVGVSRQHRAVVLGELGGLLVNGSGTECRPGTLVVAEATLTNHFGRRARHQCDRQRGHQNAGLECGRGVSRGSGVNHATEFTL